MMMNSRSRTGFALALGLTLFGCGGDEPVFQPPEVTVTTPEQRAVLDFFDFTGSTRAIAYAEIRARVSGVLEEMRFVPGGIVEANEILVVIERDQYQAAYQEALGNLRAAQAESARAEADLKRVEQAIRTEAVSESDLDRAVANRDQANAGVISARGRRNNAKLNLDYTLVRAPHRGQVGRNLWDIGNLVGAGEPTLLTTVNTIDSIYVYFDVAEALVLRLNQVRRETIAAGGDVNRVGRTAISLANETGFPHEGVIDFVDNAVDPATGTIELRAVFANPDLSLFPGLFVRVRVYASRETDALLVDERAIGTDLAGKYVFVLDEENVVEQRFVTLGPLQDDGMIVVEDGLDGSESYIVNGLLRARPGFPVTPQYADSAVVAPVERG
ncbi:MAG: efflux RND transporter periplasmic adaptor subunit [Gemmatimonadales bacterium]